MKRAIHFILFSCLIFSVAYMAASDKTNKVEQYQINKKQVLINQEESNKATDQKSLENNLKIKSELKNI